MAKFNTSQARNELSRLLNRVMRGENIVITRRGEPVAMLVPPAPEERDVRQLANEMLTWRDHEGPTLGPDIAIRELIEEGRRN